MTCPFRLCSFFRSFLQRFQSRFCALQVLLLFFFFIRQSRTCTRRQTGCCSCASVIPLFFLWTFVDIIFSQMFTKENVTAPPVAASWSHELPIKRKRVEKKKNSPCLCTPHFFFFFTFKPSPPCGSKTLFLPQGSGHSSRNKQKTKNLWYFFTLKTSIIVT